MLSQQTKTHTKPRDRESYSINEYRHTVDFRRRHELKLCWSESSNKVNSAVVREDLGSSLENHHVIPTRPVNGC